MGLSALWRVHQSIHPVGILRDVLNFKAAVYLVGPEGDKRTGWVILLCRGEHGARKELRAEKGSLGSLLYILSSQLESHSFEEWGHFNLRDGYSVLYLDC